MQSLVINLARAPGRWASMSALGTARGLAFERLEAVDGRDPDLLAKSACGGGGLRPGEVACFESHRAAWRRIAAGTGSHGLVMEDDVFPAGDLAPWLAAAAEALPALDIIKLNAHPRGALMRRMPLAVVAGRAVVQPTHATDDSSAYLITRGFAERALALHAGYSRPLDVALFDPATGVRLGQADPALTIQQKDASFRFLDTEAEATSIQVTLEERRLERPRKGPVEAAAAELRRFGRRKVWPAVQPALNLLRPAAERLEFRRIAFEDRAP